MDRHVLIYSVYMAPPPPVPVAFVESNEEWEEELPHMTPEEEDEELMEVERQVEELQEAYRQKKAMDELVMRGAAFAIAAAILTRG